MNCVCSGHGEEQGCALSPRDQAGPGSGGWSWFRGLVTEPPENLGNRNDTAKSYFSHLAMETKMTAQEGEVTC